MFGVIAWHGIIWPHEGGALPSRIRPIRSGACSAVTTTVSTIVAHFPPSTCYGVLSLDRSLPPNHRAESEISHHTNHLQSEK